MNRVAVIGLDAAEPQLVDQMMAAGELPTLSRLKRSGGTCRLHSEATWRSGRVWETLLTGAADFPSAALFDPATYESYQLGSRRKPPFYANIPGLNLLAIDVPYMSLWYDTAGAQVIWGGHDAGYPRASRPAGLVKQIDSKFGVHPAFHNDFDCAWYHAPSINTLADALVTGLRRRVDVIAWLMQQFPNWNLFMTVLSEAHSAGEMFWHGLAENHPLTNSPTAPLARARLLEVYRELDRAVARIVKLMPVDTRVLVCTVHGMEMNDYDVPSMALLPELLYRATFGKPLLQGPNVKHWRRRGCPPVFPRDQLKWNSHIKRYFGVSPVGRAWKDVRSVLRLRRHKRRAIEDLVVPIPAETVLPPEQIDEPRSRLDWQPTCWYKQYWPLMRAFAIPVFYDGRVRINLRGRERQGIVQPADYRETCNWVEQVVTECRNLRDGRPVLADIERRIDHPFDRDGADADLTVTWNPAIDGLIHPQYGTIGPFPFRRTGGHTGRGVAYVTGPGIPVEDWGLQEALDLTPTILSLLGHQQERSIIPTATWAA
jgi:predicted AlkP superfamily phosphohydrolase/phosphomutase